jgi:hypothetical protein
VKSFILYDGLPLKSGGGHHLSRLSSQEILDSVTEFIATYTDGKHPSVSILMSQFKFGQFIRFCLRFGIPNFNWWGYWAIKKDLVSWSTSSKSLNDKLKLIIADNNLLMSVTWRFYFVDPETGTLLPNQKDLPVIDERKPRSDVYLRLSNFKKTASVWFALPFEELDDVSLNYISALQRALPFKFSSKSWRIYNQSKNGNWFARKLEVNNP